ncbi:MAG: autotransporter outer membrane beta-barrel domain-containing protein [Spirochaetaceae bacterium]|nr:autotransporter outer membrane beta-barrel domain-containing protein [Spirochaetaceae bacterium]
MFLNALDIDMGLGLNFGYNYSSIKTTKNSASLEQGYGVGGIGQFLFIDATYVEGTINFFFANTSLKHNDVLSEYDGFSGDYNLNGVSLGLGLLLKYPFYFGSLVFFPLLGFEGNIYLSQGFSKDYDEADDSKQGDTYGKPSAWNSFWIRVGAGVDYFFSGAVYIRGEVLMDIKLPSGLDTAYMKNEKFISNGFSDPQFFGLGVSFRAAVGFKISNLLLGSVQSPRSVVSPPKESTPKKPSAKIPPKKKRDTNVYVPQD